MAESNLKTILPFRRKRQTSLTLTQGVQIHTDRGLHKSKKLYTLQFIFNITPINSFNTKTAYVLCASWLLRYCMVSNFKFLWQFLTDVSEKLIFCQRHLRNFLGRICTNPMSVSFNFSSVNNQCFRSLIALPSKDPVCLILFTIVKNNVSICSCIILKFMLEHPLPFSGTITFHKATTWTLITCDITTQDKPRLSVYLMQQQGLGTTVVRHITHTIASS